MSDKNNKEIPKAIETDIEDTTEQDKAELEAFGKELETGNNNDKVEILSFFEQEKQQSTNASKTDQFESFLRMFSDKKTGDYKYYNLIGEIAFSSYPVFVFDFNDLINYLDTESNILPLFYSEIDETLKSMTQAVKQIILDFNSDFDKDNTPVAVRIANFDFNKSLRNIDADLVDKMVSIDAMVNHSTKKKPYLLQSVYRCLNCGFYHPTTKNKMISKCPQCDSRRLALDKTKSKFTSQMEIVIQELPDDLPPGQLPHKLDVVLYGKDLVDSCRSGDRVTLTAIVRLGYDGSKTMKELELNDPLEIMDNFGTTFELQLEANNITKIEGFTPSGDKGKQQTLLPSDIKKITELANSYTLYEDLIASFAPHIYGHAELKEVALLIVLGAKRKVIDYTTKRGDINGLFVGDPGVAKSEILKFAFKIAPRAVYTSGRGSSAAGLTAAVVKSESGQMVLEAGAVVMADQGLCVIDEFDKLKSDDRSALHETMENQTYHVAKGGIIATLNTRTAILAAANPIEGTYNAYKSIRENTGLPPSLISRFDFIFALKDKVNREQDTAISEAMLNVSSQNSVESPFTVDFLIKYLHYIKHHIKESPRMTKEAKQCIKDIYNEYRQFSQQDAQGNTLSITVTPRVVDVLSRVSEARALLLQKDKIEKEDVERAKYLMNKMYESFGVDISAGKVNLGIIYGKELSKMSRTKLLLQILDGITQQGKLEVDYDNLVKELMETGKFINKMDADSTIKLAESEQVITKIPGKRTYRFNKDVITG